MRLSKLVKIWENEIEDKGREELENLRAELIEKRENKYNFYTSDDIQVFKSKIYRLNRILGV